MKPKLQNISAQVIQGLSALELSTAALGEYAPLINSSLGGIQAGAQLANLVPETLTTLKGTLLESAELLQASSSVTAEAKEGISGLILPKKELTGSAILMNKTATQLRLMSGMIDQLQSVSFALSKHTTQVSSQLLQLKTDLGTMAQALNSMANRIRNANNSIISLALPTQLSLAVMGVGGLYAFMGVLLLTLSLVYERLAQLGQIEYSTKESQKKAA